jgi:hypothetical protein
MKKHLGKIVYGVLLLILIITGVWASNCEKFEIFGVYSSPRCKVDAVYFDAEICEICGNNVLDTGVLEPTGIEKSSLTFSEHFSSLEEYYSLKNKILVPSVIMAVDIAFIIAVTFYFIYVSCKKRKLKRRFNK